MLQEPITCCVYGRNWTRIINCKEPIQCTFWWYDLSAEKHTKMAYPGDPEPWFIIPENLPFKVLSASIESLKIEISSVACDINESAPSRASTDIPYLAEHIYTAYREHIGNMAGSYGNIPPWADTWPQHTAWSAERDAWIAAANAARDWIEGPHKVTTHK